MIIRSVKFIKSSPSVADCPKTDLPEYAFIGRSNVGKSSLINMLAGRKIAMTSSTPGKTLLINHFLINDNWYLVDLPGYGYAKASKTVRSGLLPMISEYISKREQMVLLFVLIDSRLEPQKTDLEFINKLGQSQIPFALIYTKIDKLSKTALNRNIENHKKALNEYWDELPVIFTESAENKTGRDDILDYIESINAESIK